MSTPSAPTTGEPAPTMDGHTPDIATLRGIVRMAALVVMEEVGEVDTALATAIAAKAGINLHQHLDEVIRDRMAYAWKQGHHTPWAEMAIAPGMSDVPAPNPYERSTAGEHA